MSFLVTTVSASLVSEAWMFASKKTHESSRNPSHQFLFCIDKEICLTVWKIIPIRRSFIFGTVGTIFTYVILFDNFNTPESILTT
ncbi:hypothetical protein CDAR_34561 [Caerostris darwini]|uniref:Uncharacterized protein n=1 Tax=Caerostris darwini TaxID=1538125 RepID=A0AAV4QDP5_9ARAC|nr:hypothetical protein CDAR_34561 [Caerostris darwini]